MTPTFRPGQMVPIDITLLAVTSAGNAEKLATTRYRKLMPKVMEPFAIVSVQPNMQTVDEHGIKIAVSIDRATLAPGNEPLINASQRLPLKEDHQTNFVAKRAKQQL